MVTSQYLRSIACPANETSMFGIPDIPDPHELGGQRNLVSLFFFQRGCKDCCVGAKKPKVLELVLYDPFCAVFEINQTACFCIYLLVSIWTLFTIFEMRQAAYSKWKSGQNMEMRQMQTFKISNYCTVGRFVKQLRLSVAANIIAEKDHVDL